MQRIKTADERQVNMRDVSDNQADADLIARIADKDSAAFRLLSERYMTMLFSAVYRLGFERAHAEDIVQDALLKVWQKADQWNPEKGAAVKTWLYRIAYNQAVDERRKQKKTVAIEDTNLIATETSDKGLEDAQRKKFVRNAINALPERQRTALVLCHYQGLSNIEAANIMGSSVKAIEGLLVRARKTLYEDLKALRGVL